MGLFDKMRQESLESSIKSSMQSSRYFEGVKGGENIAAKYAARAEKYKAELQAEMIASKLKNK